MTELSSKVIMIELLESRISPVIPLNPKTPLNGATMFLSLSFNIKSPLLTYSLRSNSEIKIGIRDGGYVEVLSGLNEGENIVAEGLKKVRPKGKIKPIKKKCILLT